MISVLSGHYAKGIPFLYSRYRVVIIFVNNLRRSILSSELSLLRIPGEGIVIKIMRLEASEKIGCLQQYLDRWTSQYYQ